MANELQIVLKGVDQASGVIGGVKGALGGLGGLAKGALAVGLGAAAAGVSALGAGLAISVKEAMAAQEVQAQLNAVIKSTGGVAGWTAEMANNLASELQNVTRYEDDAILSGQSLLLTFTNIGKDIFPEATETMLDMSTALGQDLKSSAIQLGKALQDPVNGVTALRRVGVNFSDAQQDMIKAMVESGDLMGAQRYILEELQREFGGAARAAGETFAGKLDILRNKFGEVKETIGAAILPVLDALLTKLLEVMNSPEVQAAIDAVASLIRDRLVPAIQGVANFVSNLLAPALSAVFGWLSGEGTASLGGFAASIREFIGPAVAFMREQFAWIIGWVQENWPLIQQTVQVILNAIWTVIQAVLGAIRDFWQAHGDTIMAVIRNYWTIISTIFETTLRNLFDILKFFMQLITGDTEGAMATLRGIFERTRDALTTIAGALWDSIKRIFQDGLNTIRNAWDNAMSRFRQIGEDIVNGIKRGINNAWEGFKNWLRDKIQGLIDGILSLLGISSPSAVFAAIGAQMMAGLQAGLAEAARLPEVTLRTNITRLFEVGAAPRLAPAAVASSPTWIIHNHFGPGSVRSDRDIEEIAARLEQILIHRGVRRFGV